MTKLMKTIISVMVIGFIGYLMFIDREDTKDGIYFKVQSPTKFSYQIDEQGRLYEIESSIVLNNEIVEGVK